MKRLDTIIQEVLNRLQKHTFTAAYSNSNKVKHHLDDNNVSYINFIGKNSTMGFELFDVEASTMSKLLADLKRKGCAVVDYKL